MSGPLKNYRAIPSADEHVSGVHQARLDSSPREWISIQVRTKATYFLLGCAILLPWNAFINQTPFFLSRVAGSPFHTTFSSVLSTVFTWTKLICQFYCTVTSKQSSPSRRILASLVAMIFSVASLWLSTFFRGTPLTFFIFVLLNGASVGISAAYLCIATAAGASLLGPSFLHSMLSGQGASAVASSSVQVIGTIISLSRSSAPSLSGGTKGTDDGHDQAEEMAARLFFGACAIYLCITLAAYMWLMRQPFYKSATRTLEQHREVDDGDERTPLISDDHRQTEGDAARVYRVLKDNMIFLFSAAYVFTITIAVYPAITVRVQPVNPDIHPLLFTAIHVFVFSIGDLVGRLTSSLPWLRVWSAKKILAMALSRTVFIPLVLLCNVHRPETTTGVSPIIDSDILFMLILLAMGYTLGFVITRAAIAIASLEHNPRLKGREDVDIAAALASSFTVVGLASGALCSFGVLAML